MPGDSLSFLQRLQEYGYIGYMWLLFLSVWAGTVRYLISLNGKKPTLCGWLVETTISGFVGLITAMACQYYQIDYLLTAVITGIAAHNGTRSLYIIANILKKNSVGLSDVVNTQVGSRTLAKKAGRNEHHRKANK